MTLGDLANLCLVLLQQPQPSFATGGATSTGPNYASQTNPQFSQGLVEFCINEGYKKTMGDLDDIELFLVSYTFSSTALTNSYAFPPAGYANVSHIARIFYQPFGLPYSREFRPGTELVSWAKFQRLTAQGQLNPYSYGTAPSFATVDPTRTKIFFYPGSGRAGDTVTVDYTPIPTPYAASVAPTGCPILVNATDTPVIPSDCHMAIVYYALSLLWIRAREVQMAQVTSNQYDKELATIKYKYTKLQHGDTVTIEAFGDRLSIGNF